MRSDSKFLTHGDNEIEISMIKGLFEDNNISLLIEKKGIGAYLNVHSGFNFQGSDIYVSENDYEKAVELLEVIKYDDSTQDNDGNDEWGEDERKKYESRKRKFAFIAVIVPVVILVLVILGSIVVNII